MHQLAEAFRFGQKEPIKSQIFRFLSALMKFHRIPHASFETTTSRFIQILSYCSVSPKITPLYCFISTLYIWEKKSPSKWNFRTFECLGEKSPNFLCHIWNYKSVFLSTLHHSSVMQKLLTVHFFDFWLLLLKVYRNFC